MLSGPLVFIFNFLFRTRKFKTQKKSPAQLSPCTSYLNIIVSHNTQRLFFLSPFLSFFLSLLISIFSFFLPPLLLLFLPHRCFYTKHIFCSQRVVFLYIWRPNPPDRWYTVCSQKVDLGLSRIWVFVFIFNYRLMIIECI